jgi:hypothetical protein
VLTDTRPLVMVMVQLPVRQQHLQGMLLLVLTDTRPLVLVQLQASRSPCGPYPG